MNIEINNFQTQSYIGHMDKLIKKNGFARPYRREI